MSTGFQAPGQATEPAAKKQSWFWGLFASQKDDEGDCIFCPCRPLVMYCGRFDDSPPKHVPISNGDCPECVQIWLHGVCPGCGCAQHQTCEKCEGGFDD